MEQILKRLVHQRRTSLHHSGQPRFHQRRTSLHDPGQPRFHQRRSSPDIVPVHIGIRRGDVAIKPLSSGEYFT
ncbi:hypothetical protein PtA15_2A448 [Puccinia triticina]|uniref:Uncharacterized protein n=1 Tax=Puccinia triticina TaxID=208348 RepID=A0ABY7CBU7_9BASI|nr:uncharacterized protein PtA15_2A448 [Puccinia triticina]WAQ82134.1 hypothetical protein PtA15_2A448 [Puccinia triticina]